MAEGGVGYMGYRARKCELDETLWAETSLEASLPCVLLFVDVVLRHWASVRLPSRCSTCLKFHEVTSRMPDASFISFSLLLSLLLIFYYNVCLTLHHPS
jgi:hypothetical protein